MQNWFGITQIAVVRQVLRKELGLKIVEVGSESAVVEGGDVLWTGQNKHSLCTRMGTISKAKYMKSI